MAEAIKVETDTEKLAKLKIEFDLLKKEWEAYKKSSPFYTQTQQPKLRQQGQNRSTRK